MHELSITKGDNNEVDDIALYPAGRQAVRRDEVVGFVRGYLPFVGWPAILMQAIRSHVPKVVSKLRALLHPV